MVGIPTIGLFLLATGFYNRSSAVVARALVSRGRQANPVLTYETALRRFFAYGAIRWVMADDGAIRWMADDVRGNRRRWGSGVPPARRGWCRGESRHATLRFAYRVTEECRRSATRECKPRDDVYTTVLRRFSPMAVYCDEGCNPLFGGFFASRRWVHPAGMRSL